MVSRTGRPLGHVDRDAGAEATPEGDGGARGLPESFATDGTRRGSPPAAVMAASMAAPQPGTPGVASSTAATLRAGACGRLDRRPGKLMRSSRGPAGLWRGHGADSG